MQSQLNGIAASGPAKKKPARGAFARRRGSAHNQFSLQGKVFSAKGDGAEDR
jgi:hypothetical protein